MSVVRSASIHPSRFVAPAGPARRLPAAVSAACAWLAPLALAASCAAPPAEPLSDASIVAALESRVADAATLERALEFARLAPVPFALPDAAALRDPAHPLHLRARALVYGPAMRAARRAWLAAAALDRSGAYSAPLGFEAEYEDPSGSDGELQAQLTFDLLGLFGSGRAAANRALGTAEQRSALAALWNVAWSSLHTTERARVTVLAARQRVAALAELTRVAEADRARIEILGRDGYARPDQLRWAWSVFGMIAERRLHEAIAVAEAEANFATSIGLPIDAARAWLDEHGASASALDFECGDARLPASDALSLLANHPRLLSARLEHAVAEARVQLAASELVPELRVGPQPRFAPGEITGGGVLELDLAWPAAVRANVRSLVQRRESARERLEDELLALQNELAAKTETLRLERDESLPRAAEVDVGAESMWTTARVRFANATDVLEEWSFALEHRVEPLLGTITAREHARLAELEWSERLGSPDVGASTLAATAREERP